MDSVIYDHSKCIVTQDGTDRTYLLSHYNIPNLLYIKACNQKPTAQITISNDSPLLFDSKFESGNLLKAIRAQPNTYHLYLQQDDNEKKDKMWYYFAVYNTTKGTNIISN